MKIFSPHILVISISILLLSACNKPVYKYNPDFEGTWLTVPVYDSLLQYVSVSEIIIDGPDGSYKNSCSTCGDDLCNCISFQYGKAVMNDTKTNMRIGSNGFSLAINEEPNIDTNGLWTMTVGNKVYFKE